MSKECNPVPQQKNTQQVNRITVDMHLNKPISDIPNSEMSDVNLAGSMHTATELQQEKEIRDLKSALLKMTGDLAAAESELSKVFQQGNEGFYTKDILANRYLKISVGCEKISGYSFREFDTNPNLLTEIIHPDDHSKLVMENDLLFKGNQIKNNFRFIHKDGGTKWVEVKVIPFLVDGRLVKVDGVINDITERKLAEQSVIDSEMKYRSFFEKSMDGILLSEPYGQILEANPAACEIFRTSEKEICTFSHRELVNFAEPEMVKLINERRRTGKFRGELTLSRRDGTRFPAEIDSSIYQDTNGENRSCIFVRDITERKKAESNLLNNERQLNFIYHAVVDSIFMVDIEEGRFKFISVNKAFLTVRGLSVEDVIGKYAEEVIPAAFVEQALCRFREAVAGKIIVTWEEQIVYASGVKTGIVSLNPVFDEAGNCFRIIGSVHDITERKKKEEEIKRSEQNFQSLVNTIDGIVWEANPDTFQFSFVSKQAESLLGYPVSEWISNPLFWREHLHPDDRDAAVEFCARNNRERLSHKLEYRMIAADGRAVWLEDIVTIVVNDDGSCYLRGIMVEISGRKNHEQAIREGEERYRTVVEQASDAIFIIAKTGDVLDSNQSGCNMIGLSRQHLQSMNISQILGTENQDPLIPFRMKKMEVGDTFITERNARHSNGYLVPIDISSKVLSDGRIIAIVRDISERKKAEKIIRDSEERIKMIMNAALDAIICVDTNDTITFCNPQAEKIFGWRRSEIVGGSLSGLIIPAAVRENQRERTRNYLRTGHDKMLNVLLELNLVNCEGVEFPVELTILPIKQGGTEFFCAFIRDITERKLSENRILDSERRYRKLFEQNMAGVYQTTVAGRIRACNPAFAQMLGHHSPEELLQTYASEFYRADEHGNDFISRLRAERKLYNNELNLKINDGTELHVIENVSLSLDSETGEEVIDGVMIDITERKKADAMLKESEQRYRQIVETAQEGIWMTDENSNTIFVNKKMCDLLGYSSEEMLGKHFSFFTVSPDDFILKSFMERDMGNILENMDMHFMTKTGNRIWTNLSVSPVLNDDRIMMGNLVMVTDITNRKLDEEIIKKAGISLDNKNQELKRKNTELEQFAYVASHDLQEPMRTVSSFVQLLQKQYQGKLDATADKCIQFIIDSSERMKILIQDLLEYSRIGTKAGLEIIDCNSIMSNVLADLHLAITDAGGMINCGPLPVICGHATEIKQLFQNLLTNALKFRKRDIAPVIEVEAVKDNGFWRFSFRDNGIGIEEVYNERIFVIFQRLHTRTEYQGSGIGLAHCKKIVELHNGNIWVDSLPGEGSVFSFTIPLDEC